MSEMALKDYELLSIKLKLQMAESPKTEVLSILEAKWDTLAFANAPIRGVTVDLFYLTNGVAWWCVASLDGLPEFDYDTPEDWPHWQEILKELKTLQK